MILLYLLITTANAAAVSVSAFNGDALATTLFVAATVLWLGNFVLAVVNDNV